ncbi:MAG: hypothetical protein KDK39_18365 [Leptospiraceae bacterium]|nr:hypothetical protein [Leptospiraceae bacterium]
MKKAIQLISLLAVVSFMACPGKGSDSTDSAELPEAQSLPADQINVDNADKQADALLKDLENL